MKQGYSLWVATASVLAVLIIVGFSVYLKKAKPISPAASPSIFVTATSGITSPSPEISSTESPLPSPFASATSLSNLTNEQQAMQAYARGDFATAITKYNLAIKETTDKKKQASLYNFLGNSYRDNKNLDLAISAYTKAYTLDPSLVEAYINKAAIYLGQGKKDDARATLEAGLKANPNNPDLSRELSTVNFSGGGAQ